MLGSFYLLGHDNLFVYVEGKEAHLRCLLSELGRELLGVVTTVVKRAYALRTFVFGGGLRFQGWLMEW